MEGVIKKSEKNPYTLLLDLLLVFIGVEGGSSGGVPGRRVLFGQRHAKISGWHNNGQKKGIKIYLILCISPEFQTKVHSRVPILSLDK